jgi:hypothetical protein
MGSEYASDVLKLVKAQCSEHIALLEEQGYSWRRDLALFRKDGEGAERIEFDPIQLAHMTLDELKTKLGVKGL